MARPRNDAPISGIRLGTLADHVNRVVIKDRIQRHFVEIAAKEAVLREWKEKHGFCAGMITCMTHVGGVGGGYTTCAMCRAAKTNPDKRKNKRSAYGIIREREKEAERKKAAAEKKRLAAAKKSRAA